MYMQRNNGRLYFNHRIREDGKKINIFDKVNTIKKELKDIFPEISGDMLLSMLSHCRRHYEGKLHYGRRSNPDNVARVGELTTNESILYEYLLKNNLNPSTSYRWFLATRVPDDIKERLAKGKLSYKKALIISANRKRVRESNDALSMVEEINNIIRSL